MGTDSEAVADAFYIECHSNVNVQVDKTHHDELQTVTSKYYCSQCLNFRPLQLNLCQRGSSHSRHSAWHHTINNKIWTRSLVPWHPTECLALEDAQSRASLYTNLGNPVVHLRYPWTINGAWLLQLRPSLTLRCQFTSLCHKYTLQNPHQE